MFINLIIQINHYISLKTWRIDFNHCEYVVILVLSLIEYYKNDYTRDHDE